MTLHTEIRSVDGVIVVNKPAGLTSHDVVAKVRRLLGGAKAGHTGTLDPLATGVLPVCVGRATRIAEYLTNREKRYRCVLKLGVTTDTDDAAGSVIRVEDASGVGRERIVATIEGMVGEGSQTPPMYSAVKIGGERLYKAARRGESVDRPSRPIVLYRMAVLRVEGDTVEFEVDCSKGTYVRALCRDIGDRLGIGGHLVRLERTRSGGFGIEESFTLEEIERRAAGEDISGLIIPMVKAMTGVPSVSVDAVGLDDVAHGRPIREVDAVLRGGEVRDGDLVVIVGPDGMLAAVARRTSERLLKMEKVFIDA